MAKQGIPDLNISELYVSCTELTAGEVSCQLKDRLKPAYALAVGRERTSTPQAVRWWKPLSSSTEQRSSRSCATLGDPGKLRHGPSPDLICVVEYVLGLDESPSDLRNTHACCRCWKQAQSLLQHKPEMDSAGVSLVAIGIGMHSVQDHCYVKLHTASRDCIHWILLKIFFRPGTPSCQQDASAGS